MSCSFRQAPIFLGIFTFMIATGALVAVIPGLPLTRVLLVTQVINGLLLPVTLIAALRLAGDRELMGRHANGIFYSVAAWLTVIVVSALSVLYMASTLFPSAFPR